MEKGDRLREKILKIGLKYWPNVNTCRIAKELGLPHPNVSYYFGRKLKDAVAEYAVEIGNSKIIAQLILTEHKAIKNMSVSDRRKHMKAAVD